MFISWLFGYSLACMDQFHVGPFVAILADFVPPSSLSVNLRWLRYCAIDVCAPVIYSNILTDGIGLF